MKTTNFFFLIIIFCITVFTVKAQKFIEIDTINTKYRFPKLVYPENQKVEEKINTALQIDYLLILPNTYEDNPYKVITNKCSFGLRVKEIYEFESWTDLSKHPNVLSLKIKGRKAGDKAFIFYSFFDKRTGDSFIFGDLFSKEGFGKLQKKIPFIKKENQFIVEKEAIYINKGDAIPKKYSLEELKPYLSNYGTNLLFESDSIMKRNSLRGKFMEGKGLNYSGDTMIYEIYIPELDNNGNATIYYWSKKHKDLSFYSKSTIKNGVLQADDYYYDKFSKEEVHNMYSLHLEKQSNKTWVGDLQLGSPFYRLTFKEW